MNEQKCNCQTRIRNAINSEPSGGHDYVDEVLGLLRVTRGQRDDAERCLQAEIVGANNLLKQNDGLRATLAKFDECVHLLTGNEGGDDSLTVLRQYINEHGQAV